MTSERKKKLKTLLKYMNQQNERFFPAVQPLLDSFNLVLTADELDYLLKMKTDLYTYEQAAALSNMPQEQFDFIFETLRAKGFIKTEYYETGEERYVLHAIVVGWIEAQVPYLFGKPEEKEFAKIYHGDFIKYYKKYNYFPVRNLINSLTRRSIKSNQSIGLNNLEGKGGKKTTININSPLKASRSKVYPMKAVNDLIEEYGDKNLIGQLPCMCRHMNNLLNKPCRLNIPDSRGCIGFGDQIRSYVKYGHARFISKEEALDVIQETREKGAIHSVFHERDDINLPQIGLCNCCWDCCGLLKTYNMGAAPLMYNCYYLAKVVANPDCNGCGKCSRYCPTNAVIITGEKGNKTVSINTKLCIGCGQCVYQCPKGTLELIPLERDVFLPLIKKSEARLQP